MFKRVHQRSSDQLWQPTTIWCAFPSVQFTRTIQNYQKAYRKKVEGMKTELKSSRNANSKLTKQVKQLKSLTRVHLPSMAIGLLAGSLAVKLLGRFLKRGAKSAAPSSESDEDQEQETTQTTDADAPESA
jgi:hypothetical protein